MVDAEGLQFADSVLRLDTFPENERAAAAAIDNARVRVTAGQFSRREMRSAFSLSATAPRAAEMFGKIAPPNTTIPSGGPPRIP